MTLEKQICLVSAIALLTGVSSKAFAAGPLTNPVFRSQDPWVVFESGRYYYSDSYCGAGTICVRSSATLSGLATAAPVGVWNAPSFGPNSTDVWAPELHRVDGHWYIYYAADDQGNNDHHRLFVLRADSDDPLGSYSMANTGAPSGQLVESTGNWAIDPDVFIAQDGKLYVVWSCTSDPNGHTTQATCIAGMSDALHTAGSSAQISAPTEAWEQRTAPIQEGPVGYARNGRTYITYSASASWTHNDYSVGLLTNEDGQMLNPGSWSKTGPIFDHHGQAYGTGSVVFVQSPDGKETWNLYHGIDNLTCQPSAYSCRDIRMQKMTWAADGTPVLGYPLDPGVPIAIPSGEPGSAEAGGSAPVWGDAFGDAAEGAAMAGAVSGTWLTSGDGRVRNTTLGAGWNQIFRENNPNLEDYTLGVDAQMVGTGTTSQFPKYGVYAAYSDSNNYVSVWLDPKNKVLATYGVIHGAAVGWANCNLAAGFDPAAFNHLAIHKTGSTFSISLNGAHVAGACNDRTFDILNGQVGLVTEDTTAAYVFSMGPALTTASVVNSATGAHSGIAPGEIISVYGSGLGPVAGVTAELTGDPPRLPDMLAGVQVLFDGAAAPLYYVSNGLINVQVPYELVGKSQTMVLVSYAGAASNWTRLDVAAADPGIYVIVNYENNLLNGAGSPATRGNIITVYGTGAGQLDCVLPSGQAAPGKPLCRALDVAVAFAGVPAVVSFAGLAPGFAGLLVMNIVVPTGAAPGQQMLELTVAGFTTRTAVWLR